MECRCDMLSGASFISIFWRRVAATLWFLPPIPPENLVISSFHSDFFGKIPILQLIRVLHNLFIISFITWYHLTKLALEYYRRTLYFATCILVLFAFQVELQITSCLLNLYRVLFSCTDYFHPKVICLIATTANLFASVVIPSTLFAPYIVLFMYSSLWPGSYHCVATNQLDGHSLTKKRTYFSRQLTSCIICGFFSCNRKNVMQLTTLLLYSENGYQICANQLFGESSWSLKEYGEMGQGMYNTILISWNLE